jgi:hypothetical protein
VNSTEKTPKVYLETTMFNYFFDYERDDHAATVAFFNALSAREFEGFTSQYVIDELKAAPEPKRTAMLGLIDSYKLHILEPNDETRRMTRVYLIMGGGIPDRKYVDASHVSCASVYRMDYLLSLNCAPINKQKIKAMVNDLNVKNGYGILIICKPQEVLP